MLSSKLQSLRRVEITLLFLFMFSLPLFEAPKNIFWVLYAAVWLAGRLCSGNFGGPWKTWDTLFSLWILSASLSTLFGALMPLPALPVDIIRYVGLAWLILRAGYSKETLYPIFISIVAATLLALGQAYWALFATTTAKHLELQSVGHVNHSAIYLAIVLCAASARFMAQAVIPPYRSSYRWLAIMMFLALSLLVTSSRGAVLAALVTIPAYLVLSGSLKKIKLRTLFAGLLALGIVAGSYALTLKLRPEILVAGGITAKNTNNLAQHDYLSNRDRLWELAAVTGMANPWLGVGVSQFGSVDAAHYCAWRQKIEASYACATENYLNLGHAHNLYLNTLAERGFLGLGVLLLALCAWLGMLIKTRHLITNDFRAGTLWGGAFAAWGVTVTSGLFNTSLHHEHALLSLILLALWLSWRSADQASLSKA
ncbi:MAG: O-antigen ligase family protein [Pseudomonadota bacterium]